MIKKLMILPMVLLAVWMPACGSASTATDAADPTSDSPTMELPVTMQIILGSYRLEGSQQAITAEQAANLLPLWQVYNDLSESDAAAQAEIDALLEQIQESMTPEQMSAIEALQLTREDMGVIMQEQGIGMGGGRGADNTESQRNGGGFAPPDGGMMSGDPGMGPGQGPGGQTNLTQEQLATAQAARTQGGGFNRIPTPLLEAYIQFLEKKAGS